MVVAFHVGPKSRIIGHDRLRERIDALDEVGELCREALVAGEHGDAGEEVNAWRYGGGIAVAFAIHLDLSGTLVVVEVNVEETLGVTLTGSALDHHGRR